MLISSDGGQFLCSCFTDPVYRTHSGCEGQTTVSLDGQTEGLHQVETHDALRCSGVNQVQGRVGCSITILNVHRQRTNHLQWHLPKPEQARLGRFKATSLEQVPGHTEAEYRT